MRTIQRRAGVFCLLSALVLLVFTTTAGADDDIRIIDSGTADELVAPPSPACDDLVLITEVTFSPDGVPIDIPRFGVGPDLVIVYDVPGFEAVGPGAIILDEVITYDAHRGRDIWAAQANERVRLEFLLNGVSQVMTPFTPDLPDGTLGSWLVIDMGTYDLPNGADTMRIHHFNNPGNTDSVVVSALCGRHEEFPEEPTSTTIAPTTIAPTTVVATTVAPTTTVAGTTTVAAETTTVAEEVSTDVEGQVEEAAQLAATGFDDLRMALIAAALILLGSAFIFWSKDHDDLILDS
ncbi:MAG: hypothetical protein ACI81L_001660 [Verrucomicrobiales bacterium]|jgi:hypothetical protein